MPSQERSELLIDLGGDDMEGGGGGELNGVKASMADNNKENDQILDKVGSDIQTDATEQV